MNKNKRLGIGLTNQLQEWGAELKIDGVSVEKDWRYDAFVDFLSYSPSYQMTCLYHYGRCNYEDLPDDREQLVQVLKDFGDYGALMDGEWWNKTGKYLFGLRAPLPKVEAKGLLNQQRSSLITTRNHHDTLIVSLPLTLAPVQVIKQLKTIMDGYEFSTAMSGEIEPPKYCLATSKLQKQTILDAFDAFRLYLSGRPLWQIGNILELIPEQCFNESILKGEKPHLVRENKRILGIAASREVKRGFNLAENAARGRFPSDSAATDYFNRQWNFGFTPTGIKANPSSSKRKVGRPPKREKDDAPK